MEWIKGFIWGNRIKIKVVPLRSPRQPGMVLFQFAVAMLS